MQSFVLLHWLMFNASLRESHISWTIILLILPICVLARLMSLHSGLVLKSLLWSFIYIYIYIYTHTHHIYIYIHTHTYTSYIYVYTHIHIIYIYIYIYIHTHTHHTYIYIHTHTHTHHTYIYILIHIIYIYIYIYIYTHTQRHQGIKMQTNGRGCCCYINTLKIPLANILRLLAEWSVTESNVKFGWVSIPASSVLHV